MWYTAVTTEIMQYWSLTEAKTQGHGECHSLNNIRGAICKKSSRAVSAAMRECLAAP